MTPEPHSRFRISTYWPHIGICCGLFLTVLGPITGDEKLIASGANLLTVSSVFLMSRKRSEK